MVDIWSVGCIFAELVWRRAFLPSATDAEHILQICQALGAPAESNWPGVSQLPLYTNFAAEYPLKGRDAFRAYFPPLGELGVDLIMKMLTFDPRKRITAREVLEHEYWTAEPAPTRNEDLPKNQNGGKETLGADLARQPGKLEDERAGGVARRLFG